MGAGQILILIGVLALAGVPMLNGFVSEWLLLQAFLFSQQISIPSLIMILPIAAAVEFWFLALQPM